VEGSPRRVDHVDRALRGPSLLVRRHRALRRAIRRADRRRGSGCPGVPPPSPQRATRLPRLIGRGCAWRRRPRHGWRV